VFKKWGKDKFNFGMRPFSNCRSIFALMVHSRKNRAHIHMWKTNISFWRKEKTSGDTSLLNITKLSLELIILLIIIKIQCVQFFYDMNSYCIYQSDKQKNYFETFMVFQNSFLCVISKTFHQASFSAPHFYNFFISSSCKCKNLYKYQFMPETFAQKC
jgi:hypothetical protein